MGVMLCFNCFPDQIYIQGPADTYSHETMNRKVARRILLLDPYRPNRYKKRFEFFLQVLPNHLLTQQKKDKYGAHLVRSRIFNSWANPLQVKPSFFLCFPPCRPPSTAPRPRPLKTQISLEKSCVPASQLNSWETQLHLLCELKGLGSA